MFSMSNAANLNKKFSRLMGKTLSLLLAGFAVTTCQLVGSQHASAQTPATFRHPGILVNQAQLDFIKTQVNAGKNPWLAAFNKASTSTYASLSYTPHPWQTVDCSPSAGINQGCSDELSDSDAAYTQALLWYITGNQQYAQNSVAIMNAWSSTLTGGHTNSNADLQAGWTGSLWPEAAEIIRATYNGWSATDITHLQNMLATQYVPNLINGAPCKNGNWELIITEALMNISVFNENPTWFNKAVSMWRARVPAYMYLSSDGPTPVPPPNCSTSVTTYWNQTQFVDGLAQESARDFGHTFWGLAASVNTAETAFQQGIDLYAENAQRIMAALEFHDYINNGGTPPSGINLGPIGGNANTMEIVYNHYVNRRGNSMPQTAQQIAHWRPTGLNYFLAWETLTHAEVGWVGLQDFSLSATPASQTVAASNGTSYTTMVTPSNGFSGAVAFSVTGLPGGATATFNPASINGSGSSTLTITNAIPVGSYPLKITGTSGSLSHAASATLVVNQSATAITLTSSQDPTTAGQNVTFTVAVSSPLAIGSVQFMDNGNAMGSPVTLNSGIASYTTSAMTVGTHNITASYSGDTNFLGSTSSALAQAIMVTGGVSTSTGLTVPATIFFHQKKSVTFVVTVTSTSAIPKGNVILIDGNTEVGTLLSLDASGRCSYSANLNQPLLHIGMHNIQAIYLGDSNSGMNGSSSLPQRINVSPRPNPH